MSRCDRRGPSYDMAGFRLQEAISQKPCENPYQMTDEQLETELMNRGKQSQGTREDMIIALTTLDNCKLTKIFMHQTS